MKRKIIKAEELITLTLTKTEHKQLIDFIKRATFHMDYNGNPNETQFSYCIYCYNVEYEGHEKDCKALKFLEILER